MSLHSITLRPTSRQRLGENEQRGPSKVNVQPFLILERTPCRTSKAVVAKTYRMTLLGACAATSAGCNGWCSLDRAQKG